MAMAAGETKIVTASLFKNGYAMVVRKLAVTGNTTTTADIPQAALGTFWITTTGDLKIVDLVATQEERKSTSSPGTYPEFLALNVGKEVSLTTVNLGEIKGKLLSVVGDTIMIERAGTVLMIGFGEVRMITVGKDGVTTTTRSHMQRVLRFKTSGTGELVMYGLERGMTWSPAYAIDLLDDKKLSLTAKSTVINDLGELADVDLKFVTGFPNVPWATLAEPLLSGQSVDQFTGFLASVGIPAAGFGGGGRRDAMSQNMAPGSPAADFGGGFEVNSGGGNQAEDLFFYKRDGITLKRGDRGFYILFQAKSDYEHLYTVDLTDSIQSNTRYVGGQEGPSDVWHSLKLKNNSGQPLTTAPVTVFKEGQILGQDTLMYTSAGAPLMVKMSKALDIRVEATEEEVKRERSALRTPNGVVYDLVTLKGTISMRSFKTTDVAMRIQKETTGEVVESTGTPAVVKLAKGLIEINPRSRLTWTPTLGAGKTMEVTFTYKVYVNS
jgi:hypothetical protein